MHSSALKWHLGRVHHLPPQTYSPSFCTPLPLPCPLACAWVQLMEDTRQSLGDKRRESKVGLLIPLLCPCKDIQVVSLCSTKGHSSLGQPFLPPHHCCVPPPPLLCPSSSWVPYTCQHLLKDPFSKPSSKDSVYICHLPPSRALNDTGLE